MSFPESIQRDEPALLREIKKHPTSAEPNYLYAWYLWATRKEYDKAEQYYQKAIEFEPRNHIALGAYAAFLFDVRQDYERAQTLFEEALSIAPANSWNLGNYGFFLKKVRKEYERAGELLEKAIKLDSGNASALENYAILLADIRNDFAGAYKYYRKAMQLAPHNARFLGKYAQFCIAVRSDFKEAEKYLKMGLKDDPNDLLCLSEYASFLNEIKKDFDGAERYYVKATQVAPSDARMWVNYANFLTHRRKNYAAAEEAFGKALALASDSRTTSHVQATYAQLLDAEGSRGEEVKQWCRTAVKNDPTRGEILTTCAILMIRNHAFDEAEQLFTEAIALPKADYAWFRYGAFLSLRNPSRTRECFEKAIQLNPGRTEYKRGLADFLLDSGKDIPLARLLLTEVLQAEPKEGANLAAWGRFLLQVDKDYRRAAVFLDRATKASPDNAWYLADLAHVLILQRELPSAKRAITKAFELNSEPGAEDAELALQLQYYCYAVFWSDFPDSVLLTRKLLEHGARLQGWTVEGVSSAAGTLGHPDITMVQQLEAEMRAPTPKSGSFLGPRTD